MTTGTASRRHPRRHHHPPAAASPGPPSPGRDDGAGSVTSGRRRIRGGRIIKRGSGVSSTMTTTMAVGAMILILVVALYLYAAYLLRVASVLDGRHRHRNNSPPWDGGGGSGSGAGGGGSGIRVGMDYSDGGVDENTWRFDRDTALEVQRRLLASTGRRSPILTAYAEPPLPPPKSESGSVSKSKSSVVPRLPPRTHGPEALRRYPYPRVTTCGSLPASLPVDDGGALNDNRKKNTPTFPHRYEYAERQHCPVDADPFLPWIHDVFPTSDGRYLEFVAHNKRRCNTDAKVYADDMSNLEPQVTLMQPVPLKRLTDGEATELAPDLWRPPSASAADREDGGSNVVGGGGHNRYRLASYGDADTDAAQTRFICRFHTHVASATRDDDGNSNLGGVRSVHLGETLSVYPYNYEYANQKKPQHHAMLTGPPDRPDNKNRTDSAHNEQFWNAVLHFRCPVPPHLWDVIASGESVVDDVATIYVDLVPVRTYSRTDELGYFGGDNETNFVPDVEWGRRNVLPRVEVSGRWANFHVCRPPGLPLDVDGAAAGAAAAGVTANADHPHPSDPENGGGLLRQIENTQRQAQRREIAAATVATATTTTPKKKKKRHELVACTWASASFHTRGNRGQADTSTPRRLLEWLTYHLYVADFDHVYVYDNSASDASHNNVNGNQTSSLAPVVDLFPPSRVTRIEWPFRVCNNNPPASSNPGERSSQYAAETSCRVRYGPQTEWMSFLDVDEYIIPQRGLNEYGNSIKRWLMDEEGSVGRETNILSFHQTRAKPNVEHMERAARRGDGGIVGGCGEEAADASAAASAADDDDECPLLTKRPDATYLETYDCDPTPLPKPEWGWRAKKQIYRPWYVLYHHVHYPTVTRRLLDHPNELSLKYNDKKPSERRVDELNEAFMIHAKTTDADATSGWRGKCRGGGGGGGGGDACPVGIPWPGVDGSGTGTGGGEGGGQKFDADGMGYNCHRHGAVGDVLPRLRAELAPLIERYTAKH